MRLMRWLTVAGLGYAAYKGYQKYRDAPPRSGG